MPRAASGPGSPQWSTALPTLVGLALVLGFLYWARPVLIPLALAILLTFLLAPLVTWLTRRHLGRVLSAVLVTLAALALTGFIGWTIARQVTALVESYPKYEKNINAKIASLRWVGQEGTLEKAMDVTRRVQGQLERADVEDTPEEREVRRAQPVRLVVDPGPFRVAEFWSIAGPILAPLAAAALVIVLVFFMLLNKEDLRDRFIALIGEHQLAHTTNALDDAGSRISRFLVTQLAINAGFGIVVAVGLYFIGIPFAPLWGAIGFALRYIPYLGPWLAMLLPFAMSLLVTSDWSTSLTVVALFAVVEGITNLIIEPMLYGRGIGVSQPALLVAVAFWTWLWGPLGLVLASPLTVCLVVLGRHAPKLKFFDTLLGDRPALEPPQRFYQRLVARDYDEAVEIADESLKNKPLLEVFDQLLIPAFNSMRLDVRLDRIDDAGAENLSVAVREIADDLARRPVVPADDQPPAEAPSLPSTPVKVLAIPARDGADEVALSMLEALLRRDTVSWVVATRAQGAQELTELIENEKPNLVCIAAIPPGGLSQTRYLCMRLRAKFPDLHILVGRWGLLEDAQRERDQLEAAGVARMDVSLLETVQYCEHWADGRTKTEAEASTA